jgi:hypothetical protein
MPKPKKQLKEFCLVSLAKREIAKQRGKFVTAEAKGRPLDLPPGYDPRKGSWSWEANLRSYPRPSAFGTTNL